ncbi:uncharacterized protein [Patagioenas fasciata]|uniref:uncharacterized protein isoform X2 n=1 Tax=Patagioenas fasciata TaxID=372321 RepID=UPI003A9A2CD9
MDELIVRLAPFHDENCCFLGSVSNQSRDDKLWDNVLSVWQLGREMRSEMEEPCSREGRAGSLCVESSEYECGEVGKREVRTYLDYRTALPRQPVLSSSCSSSWSCVLISASAAELDSKWDLSGAGRALVSHTSRCFCCDKVARLHSRIAVVRLECSFHVKCISNADNDNSHRNKGRMSDRCYHNLHPPKESSPCETKKPESSFFILALLTSTSS